MRLADALRTMADIGAGDHLGWLYATEEEHRTLLAPFLRWGLEQNEKVLYIYAVNAPEDVTGYLEKEGLATGPYLSSGQMEFLPADAPSVRTGLLDPDGAVPFLEQATARALEQGYQSLRITVEMAGADSGRLIEAEAAADTMFPGTRCLLMCQYDRRHFDATTLLDVLAVHPIVVAEGEPYDNLYHSPFGGVQVDDPAVATLQHRLSNLAARKQVEKALQTQEEQLELLIDAVQDYAIMMLDAEGRVLTWNVGAERALGYRAAEIIGKSLVRFYPAEDIADGKPAQALQTAREQGRFEYEGWRVRKDGTAYWANVVITALYDEEGRLHGFAKVTRDITERKAAERRLRKREAQLAEAQRLAQLGSWEQNAVDDSLTWSGEFYRILGLDPQHVGPSEERFWQCVHPEDRERVEARMKQARQDLQPFEIEYRIIRPDGTVRTLHGRVDIVSDETGQLIRTLGTAQDITAQKCMQEQLQESNQLLDGLFEFGPDGTLLVDQEGGIVRANRQIEAMFGYARQELAGNPIAILLPERFREPFQQHLTAYGRRPQPHLAGAGVELCGRRKDGREFPVDVMLSSLETERGRLTIIAIRDVTDRKQEQQALRESEARFRAIFENAAMGISLVDAQGRLVATSPVFREMLGYHQDALRGRHIIEITHPEDREETQRTFQALMSGEQARVDLVKRFLHRNGRVVWARVTASCIQDAEGRAQFSLGMVEDITERKRTEGELARVRRQLAQSREEERRYLAQELHDGPIQSLHSINFQLSMLTNAPHGEEPADELAGVQETVHRTIQALRATCQDLRPPTLAPFGLEAAIRSHADHFRQAHPEITLKLDLMADGQALPENVRMALYRVYQQALRNVVQHAAAHRVRVTFRLDAERVTLEVEDDGCGFEVPRHWFELARDGHLGLVGITERVEVAGGRLDVRSAPGQGTTLRVIVPRGEEG